MLVNSAFTGFFNKRLVVSSGIPIVMLVIFFIASSFREYSDPYLRAKQVNLIIRQIGHRLLLQAGDSTSRVLPVTATKEGTFVLRFENEFVFDHDSLMVMSQGLLPKTQFPSGYAVTVHDCIKGGIVYGFQVSNTSPDILACSGRSQPPGCYTIEFTFPDFYENAEKKKADIAKVPEPVKVDPNAIKLKLEELKPTTVDYEINQRTKDLKSIEADSEGVSPKPEEKQTSSSEFPSTNVVYGGILVLLVVILLIGRFGKKLVPLKNQSDRTVEESLLKESVSELASIGRFLFDVKDQRLLLGSEVIALTDKECKVLVMLHQNFGELIPRETLMQKVWLDEGVITGRSLDMFVSKLRKKLSADTDLRITNIHGKGYKLERVNEFIS